MMKSKYTGPKSDPLTDEEIKHKYEKIQEEMNEVLEWKKETETNLKNPKLSLQKRGSAKRVLKKIARRIDTVQGQIIYWKLRVNGGSHFKASIEKNEYWARCREKAEEEKIKKEETNLPDLLKRK